MKRMDIVRIKNALLKYKLDQTSLSDAAEEIKNLIEKGSEDGEEFAHKLIDPEP